MSGRMTRKTVRIGVFIPSDTQLLDTACVDIFCMMSYEYLAPLTFLPGHLAELAPSVEILYIGSQAAGSLVELTSSMKIRPSHHLSDPEVQPGRLHALLTDAHTCSSHTTGGITNGNDLVSAYARHSQHFFPSPLVEVVLKMADVGERGQVYGQGQTRFTLGMVWQLLRAWVMGVGKTKANKSV